LLIDVFSVFGRILAGLVADRVGRFNTMIATNFFSAIIVLALWLPSRSNVPIIIFAALSGFSSGAFISLLPALVAQISDIRQIGVRNGSLFAVISVATLAGSPNGGALVTANHDGFMYLQIFCGMVLIAGSFLFVASRAVQVGFRPKII
jgi:MFS family permease